MKVCFFAHLSSLLGAERMLLDLVTDLKKHYGVTCLVVLPNRGRLSDALTGLGTQCLFAEYGWWCHASELDFRTKTRIVSTSYELLNQKIVPALQIFDPDVIWTQTLVIPWGAMAAGHLNKPHVWYVTELGEADHGFDFFCPFQKVIDDIVQSSDKVFACSQFIVDSLFPDHEKLGVEVLYNNIRIPEFGSTGASFFKVTGSVRIGIFSQVTPGKGTEDIVVAATELIQRGVNLELLVAGGGNPEYRKKLVSYVRAHGSDSRIHFAGFIDDPFSAMKATDICVICSRAEAFGRVGVEAMLLGKPVIYADAGGVREYMIDGLTGLSYSPGDVGGLVRRLTELIHDPSRCVSLGSSGHSHASQLFTREKYSGTAFRTLEALIDKGRRATSIPKAIESLATPPGDSAPISARMRRNDPCPCGSGKRFKHCHGAE
jgi:glycosyltransferase involved in cell wall biosynthesis